MNESKWEVAGSNEHRRNVQNNPTKCNCNKDNSQRSEKWSLKQKEKQPRDWLPAVPNVSPDVPRSPLPRWLYINLTLLLQMWFYWLCSWFTPRQRADPPTPPRIPSNQKKPQRGGEGNGTSSIGGETLLGKAGTLLCNIMAWDHAPGGGGRLHVSLKGRIAVQPISGFLPLRLHQCAVLFPLSSKMSSGKQW